MGEIGRHGGLRSGLCASHRFDESVGIARVGHVADIKRAVVFIDIFITVGEGKLVFSNILHELRQDGIKRGRAARLEEQAVARNGVF